MPRDIEGDAVHLAYASYYKIDYLPGTATIWQMQTNKEIDIQSLVYSPNN